MNQRRRAIVHRCSARSDQKASRCIRRCCCAFVKQACAHFQRERSRCIAEPMRQQMERTHRAFLTLVYAFDAALLEPPILQTIRPEFGADKDALDVRGRGAAKARYALLALCCQRSRCACGSGNSGLDEITTSGAHLLVSFVIWIWRHFLIGSFSKSDSLTQLALIFSPRIKRS